MNTVTEAEQDLHHRARAIVKYPLLIMFLIMGGGFLASFAMLLYVAKDFNHQDDMHSRLLLTKALTHQQESMRTQLSEYADWGDAYRFLHQQINKEWAWTKQNLGYSLYKSFGYEGVFVVSAAGKTNYSVIDGRLHYQPLEEWLGENILTDIQQALSQSGGKAVSRFIISGEQLTLLAAKEMTPGGDSTVLPRTAPPSVMVFANQITPAELQQLGAEYDIHDVRILGFSSAKILPEQGRLVIPAAGGNVIIGWQDEEHGRILLHRLGPLLLLLMLSAFLLAFLLSRNALRKARLHDESSFLLEQSRQALSANEQRLRDVVESTTDWIWEADSRLCFIWLSERFPAVTGFSIADWIGRPVHEFLLSEQHIAAQLAGLAENPAEISLSLQKCRYLSAQDHQRYCNMTVKKVFSAGNGAAFRGTATDVTLEVEAQERIRYLSHHDVLTGLANRVRMKEFLEGSLRIQPTAERSLAMVMVDLDKFKAVNDHYGHAVGDEVLHETSARLRACLKDTDLVARHGGDEFILILPDVVDREKLEKLCAYIISEVNRPFEVGGNEIQIGASLGIALAPHDAQSAGDLLRYSDIALYKAKHEGRNRWIFYQQGMAEKIIQRRELENELREAIDAEQLRLVYQPRYDVKSSNITAVEALVRWEHPRFGTIMPDQFIPLAEETGLIGRISGWVLLSACRETSENLPGMSVSVNVSASEFQDEGLFKRIKKALDMSGLASSRLEIEVTESLMLIDPVKTLKLMNQIRSLGVKFLIDDFGTGYSSLNYLRDYPFDGIKIDKSFIMSVNDSSLAMQVVQNMIGLGKAYDMEVTAEGVETEEQLEQLKKLECDVIQGYYIGKPMTVKQLQQLKINSEKNR
ncbi:diguanylate cyclase (plasmid) [Pantoea alhagi]|uniref:diguanylate cyclase n=1 Tax=Pantoea alhagi TaxID=1891675 RepID=A0A1W6BBG9_9GAMM|nr:EAL domain-containing protein [Pantoea alhagi]ARJ44414.1 diguanylate cyclase [Pantoea alhagi]